MRKIIFNCFMLLTLSIPAVAQIRLPAVIGDHMVLQQLSEDALWGWGIPGAEISVAVSWDKDQIVKAKTENTGRWMVKVKTPAAGGPYTITIKDNYSSLTITDVLVGEVWICSGQSNMEWNVYSGAADAKEEMPKANFPQIRLMQVAKAASDYPQDRGEGSWTACTPESMKGFSAAGYFFAKRLHTDLKVPIGVINASWGGTAAEVWTPASLVASDAALAASADKLRVAEWWPKTSGTAYNGMIHPLIPFGIAGVIWYQGESNVAAPATYKKLMQVMIEDWRKEFGKEFPFYYVQIAPYKYDYPFQGALIREQQAQLLSVPKTGMVVITDAVDDVTNIHPKFKKPVGDRLAGYALGATYKKPILGYQSPVYKSMTIDRNKIKVTFEYAQYGLISHNGEPTQFTIAGEDKKFYPAIAKIEGGTVTVSAKEVKAPVAVRFCFDNTSIPNLFNKEGLPVSIFRTDSWEVE